MELNISEIQNTFFCANC